MSVLRLVRKALRNPADALRRAPGWTLFRVAEWTGRWPFYLQSHMDIDPTGYDHDRAFVGETGGFFPRSGAAVRRIAPFQVKDTARRNFLLLLMRSIVERGIPGDIAELGVYTGMTARLFHEYLPDRTLRLFDTFAGFASTDLAHEGAATQAPRFVEMFTDTSVERVRAYVGARDPENLVFRVGYFPESATAEDAAQSYALVHLDADLYAPTLSGLEFFYPRISPGGFLVAHDYNAWTGARRAVDEFCGARAITPVPMPDKSGSAVIVKS